MRDAPDPARGAQPAAPAGPEGSLGNQALARFAAAFNADFSDVRFHARSADAAAIGARAFTEGADVHFAPGELRPGDRAGDELIAHELAHVVQQRERRAVPDSAGIDRSPRLEAEADAQARRAVVGEPARPGAAASRPAPGTAPVLQGSFLVSSTLSTADQSDCKAADLTVDALYVTDKKRPPTAIDKSQGRHTLAWAARVSYWAALFSGKNYLDAFKTLKALADADAAVDRAMVATAADQERQALLDTLAGITDTTAKPASKWIETLTWAITTYIKASQKASATAFPSKRPKGRNESRHLETLRNANEAFRPRTDDDTSLQEDPPSNPAIQAAARGLVDLHGGLPPVVLWKVFSDWRDMLSVTFPHIFTAKVLAMPKDSSVDALKTEGYTAVARLYAEMGITTPDPKATKETKTKVEVKDTGDEEAAAELAVTAMTGSGGAQQLAEAEPFIVRVPSSFNAGTDDSYEAKDIKVDRLVVSDERPPTKFGTAQKSHTIPWSLDRIVWIKEFSGKPMSAVIAALRQRAATEKEWSPGKTKQSVKDRRDELIQELDDAMSASWTIPRWTGWLDMRIEEYVETYEASAFATYGTEATPQGASTPASKGEGPALRGMKLIDQQIAAEITNGIARSDEEVKARGAEVRRYGAMLIDVPKLSLNITPVDPPKLMKRWLEDMKLVFPNVVAKHTADLDLAFFDAGKQDPFFAKLEEDLKSTSRPKREIKKRGGEGSSGERKKVRI